MKDFFKVAFIYGKDDKNRNIKEGQIEKLGVTSDTETMHVEYLLDYARERYSDIQVFKQFNVRYAPETVGYFFTLFGHIVFFNTTTNILKYGKTGVFLMPPDISAVQKASLYHFLSEINDFNVTIFYDLQINGGILDGKESTHIEKGNCMQLFDMYFEKNDNMKKQI